VFTYNYTINAEKLDLDTAEVMKIAKDGLQELLEKNPKAIYLKQNNVEI